MESLSIPKAEASTTLPKAPCPRVLPDRGKQYLVNGTAAELPVPQVHSQTVSYALAAALKQHAQVLIIIIIIRLRSRRKCVFDCSRDDGADYKLFNERLTFIFPKFNFAFLKNKKKYNLNLNRKDDRPVSGLRLSSQLDTFIITLLWWYQNIHIQLRREEKKKKILLLFYLIGDFTIWSYRLQFRECV